MSKMQSVGDTQLSFIQRRLIENSGHGLLLKSIDFIGSVPFLSIRGLGEWEFAM